MPEKETIERARRDRREGKSPSTQAGEFVREEIHHVREGKHGARSTKQAIAIGLSKARRVGVKLPPQKGREHEWVEATIDAVGWPKARSAIHAPVRRGEECAAARRTVGGVATRARAPCTHGRTPSLGRAAFRVGEEGGAHEGSGRPQGRGTEGGPDSRPPPEALGIATHPTPGLSIEPLGLTSVPKAQGAPIVFIAARGRPSVQACPTARTASSRSIPGRKS